MATSAEAQTNTPTITTNPASQIAFIGTSVTVSVVATGAPPLSFQWRRNTIGIPNGTNAAFTIGSATTNDSGGYSVIVSNSVGVATSTIATITILSPRMWVMGANGSGQLGDGTLLNRLAPISPLGPAALMAGGATHSLFTKPDRTLWAMGNNGFGQLGDGTTVQRVAPVQIWTNVIGLAAGANHSFFIDGGGLLWAFGDNTTGQLGDGSGVQQNTPVNVASGVIAVAAGAYHSLFVTSDGTLWAMGDNTFGQLGDGTTTSRSVPTQISSNVMMVAAGAYHSLFVRSDGCLWTMGANDSGQLGDGTTTSKNFPIQIATNVSAVAAGAYHTLFLTADSTLWAVGDNTYQQLGLGSATPHYSPVQVSTGVSNIACGYFHSLFVATNGTLWAMGANFSGQLGDGTTQQQSLPVSVAPNVQSVSAGGDHSLFTANHLQPPTISQQPDSRSAWAGENVSIKLLLNQEPDIIYRWQWRKDGTNLPGATLPILTLTNVQIADSGNYSAIINVGDVTVLTSSNALLVVAPTGAPTIWADSDEVIGSVTKNFSTLISLENRFTDGYVFYTLDGSPPNFASTLYSAPFTISNTVVIRAIWLSPDFTRTAETPPTTIKLLPFLINAVTKGGGMVIPDPAQEYYGANSTVSIVALPVDGWKFLHWDGDASGTNNPLIVTVNGSKRIEAVFGTDLLTNIIGNGRVQIVPAGPAAFGSTVQLTAFPAAGNVFVVWGNALTGTNNPATLTVNTPLPVIGALFFTPPQGAPLITTPPASTSVARGQNLTLTVQATGATLSYQWYFNGAAMPGMNASTLLITNLSPQTAGEYYVVVSGKGGTTASAPAYVAMNEFGFRPVLTVHGAPGMPFRVDYSDELSTNGWQLFTNAVLTSPRQDVIDFNPNSANRFYRVLINP